MAKFGTGDITNPHRCEAIIKSLGGETEYTKRDIINAKITHGCMGSTLCIGNSFSHILELEVNKNEMFIEGLCFRFDLIEKDTGESLYKHNFIVKDVQRNQDRMSVTAYGVFNVPVMNTLFNWEWCPSNATGEIPSFGEVLQAISDQTGILFENALGANMCETLKSIKLPYRNCSIGYENEGSKYKIRQIIEYIAGAFGCNATEGESIPGRADSVIIIDVYTTACVLSEQYGVVTLDREVYMDGNKGYFSDTGITNEEYFDRIEVRTTSSDVELHSGDVIQERTISAGFPEGEASFTLQLENPFINQERLDQIHNKLAGSGGAYEKFFTHSGTIRYAGNTMLEDYDMVYCEVGGQYTCGPAMQVVTTFDGGLSHEIMITGPETTQSVAGSGGSNIVVGGNGTFNQVIVQINKEFESNQTFQSVTTAELKAGTARITTLEADNATIKGELSAQKIVTDELTAENAEIKGTLTANEGRFQTLEADNVTIKGELSAMSGEFEELKTTTLRADEADLKYADIRLANIDVANIDRAKMGELFTELGVLKTAVIENGKITGELGAITVSANNITTGRLDAGEIEVVNLNAANITVGQINGTQIAPGAVDMTKLGADVSSWVIETDSDVSKALSDAGLANEKINNLQIGGRNLLVGSAIHNFASVSIGGSYNYSVSNNSSVLSKKIIQIECTAGGSGFFSGAGGDVTGTTYTYSFWAKCSVAKSGNIGYERGGQFNISLTTEWQYFEHTFTANDSQYGAFTWYLEWNAGEILYIHSFKIETGTKATDWTPAPEDTEDEISEVFLIANGKTTSYYQNSAPSGETYAINDIWFDTDDGFKMYYWNGSSWTETQYGSSAISANAVTAEKIAASAITAGKIATGAVTAGTIAASAVTTETIATNAIMAAHIQTGAINAEKIAVNAIKTEHIQAEAITGEKIKVNEALAEKIFAQSITATGTITGGRFVGGSFEGATGSFTGEITATSGQIGFLNVSGTLLSLDEDKYGFFRLSKDRKIEMANYGDTGAGNYAKYSNEQWELIRNEVYSGRVIKRYRAAAVPHLIRLTDYGADGTKNIHTDIRPDRIETGEVIVNSNSTKEAILKSMRAYELNLGAITISNGNPFSTSLDSVLSSVEGKLAGVALKQCWPHGTWNFACTAFTNGTTLYISTTATQTYTVSVVVFYTLN